MVNKYGVNIKVGNYVFLPLPFYDFSVFKVVDLIEEDENSSVKTRIACDEGHGHIRNFNIDNPFIKLDDDCGKSLFENNEFENKIKKIYKND